MAGQQGFTLVETIVAGVLAVVMSGILLSYFYFNSDEIRRGAAFLSMQRNYDVAAQTIGAKARKAAAVLEISESFASRKTYAASSSVSTIMMVDADEVVTARFQIASGRLNEWDTPSSAWKAFRVGQDTVKVDAANSKFSLDGGRLGMDMKLILTKVVSGKTYTLTSRGDSFRCRNVN